MKHLISRVHAYALVVGVLLCSAALGLRAQTWPACPGCPTDAPPTTIAWNSGSYITNIDFGCGHTCPVKICYCWRVTNPPLNTNWDYTITAVMLGAGCCPGLSTQTIIDDAFNKLLNDNPAHFPCPTCPNTDNEWRELRATCWSHTVDPETGVDIWQICTTHGWCDTRFSVCCDATGVHMTKKSSVKVGDCFQQGCDVIQCPY